MVSRGRAKEGRAQVFRTRKGAGLGTIQKWSCRAMGCLVWGHRLEVRSGGPCEGWDPCSREERIWASSLSPVHHSQTSIPPPKFTFAWTLPPLP